MYDNKKKQQISSNNILNASVRILNFNIDNSKYSRNFSNIDFQRSNSISNNLNMIQRPITSRSLSIKNQIEKSKDNDLNHELIEVISKTSLDKNSSNELTSIQSFEKMKNQSLINRINSPIRKTNLDYFIDYSSNPFTTKFEILNGNNDLKINKISRSQSISNLNKPKGLVDNNIVSPCLVKPFTNEGIENQSNNLFFSSNNCYKSFENYAQSNSLEKSISNENFENSEFTNLSKIDDENISNSCNTINIINGSQSYKSLNFLRITENLYTGSVKSITNERKMCKLNIEYLIDISNLRPDDLNKQSISKLPCLCKKQHSRIYLSIEITDTSFKSLFNSFSEINKFILRARKSSRRVLIFGKDNFSSIVLCACLQYLMVEYELSLRDALDGLTEICSSKLSLDSCFIEYLQQFEVYLNHMVSNLYGSNYFRNNANKINKNILIDKNKLNETEIDEESINESHIAKEINTLKKNKNKMAWM